MGVMVRLDEAARLRAEARRCRHLATGLSNPRDVDLLTAMAEEYELQALEWECGTWASRPGAPLERPR